MKDATYLKQSSGFLLYTTVKFLVLTFIAMLFYSGGNLYDPDNTHYSFLNNFFSDLGITQTYAGSSNIIPFVLFIIAMVSVGLAMLYFSLTPKAYLQKGNKGIFFQYLASIGIALSGLSFIGIAVLPWNVDLIAHVILVKLAFSFLFIYVAATLILQTFNAWPRSYLLANFIYFIFLAAYISILFWGPQIGTIEALQLQAISQKIIVYASILNLGYQAWGIFHEAYTAT